MTRRRRSRLTALLPERHFRRNEYLCSRPEILTAIAERVFASDTQGEIFDAHGLRRHATVELSCSFGTRKIFERLPSAAGRTEALCISGRFPG
ncbi:hypothetical protein, partial [Streptomyces sp. Root1304]|uniref:hypothetical protein n=1 Tax=Streptomyces sp. Root1304 TaxID=1736450 RepID=UPI001A8D4903